MRYWIIILLCFSFCTANAHGKGNASTILQEALSLIGVPVCTDSINKESDTGRKCGMWISAELSDSYGSNNEYFDYQIKLSNYNEKGDVDGISFAFLYSSTKKIYDLCFFGMYKDGLLLKAIDIYENTMYAIDKVSLLGEELPKELLKLTRKLTGIGKTPYGWIQYHLRIYSDGALIKEGLCISELDENNGYDYISDVPLEVGEWKYYDPSGCLSKKKDMTDIAINVLKNFLGW